MDIIYGGTGRSGLKRVQKHKIAHFKASKSGIFLVLVHIITPLNLSFAQLYIVLFWYLILTTYVAQVQ